MLNFPQLSIDGIDNEVLDDEIQKAIKKRTEEKKDEMDDDSDPSDNECGITKKEFKQDGEKTL